MIIDEPNKVLREKAELWREIVYKSIMTERVVKRSRKEEKRGRGIDLRSSASGGNRLDAFGHCICLLCTDNSIKRHFRCVDTCACSLQVRIPSYMAVNEIVPGAMAFTRTGIPLSANSVERSFVRCDAAALLLL